MRSLQRLVAPRLPAIVCAALLAAGCVESERETALALPPVVLASVEVRDVEERIEATGELLARNRAQLAAEVSGRVSEIVFDEGQHVEAGQVILEIDPERRELDLASAKAGRAEAQAALREQQRDYERVKKLAERDIASASRLDQTKTAVALARARADAAATQVQRAERALRDSSVKAPFSGQIAQRYVSRGEFLNVGAVLVDLVALDPIEVEFHVAERDSARVVRDQPVLVSVDPYPDELFGATVTMIAPIIDPKTRTLRVLARLENSEGRLRPGLFARADLGVELRRGVKMVPEEAILQRADGSVVFRLEEGNHVERVPVETGLHRAGYVEIRSGLRPTDYVLTRGQAGLTDGELVSPRDLDGTPIRAELAVATPVGEPAP